MSREGREGGEEIYSASFSFAQLRGLRAKNFRFVSLCLCG
jgi:hypothetical protein